MWPDTIVIFLYFKPCEQPTGGFADTSTAFGCGTLKTMGRSRVLLQYPVLSTEMILSGKFVLQGLAVIIHIMLAP